MQKVLKSLTAGKCTDFPEDWSDWNRELIAHNGRDIVSTIRILTFKVAAYAVWRERNGRFHSNEVHSPEFLVQDCGSLLGLTERAQNLHLYFTGQEKFRSPSLC